MEKAETTVRSLLATHLQVPEDSIQPDLAINGIWQWDSLAHLELMMHLEENYGLTIDETSITECSSAQGLCDRLGLSFS